jgi:hypothetical protein
VESGDHASLLGASSVGSPSHIPGGGGNGSSGSGGVHYQHNNSNGQPPSVCSFAYFQRFFDVNTSQVTTRLYR